ncbi:HD family hydrolase [Alkalibacterium sp. AK22]|uniref:HD domain-containing protein n=1 Tax=Alkalibacterium sp. AK22 TaxID=1229520 RepID=UPI0004477675|nr:HD domain-containing protein [Alkalibacterium sp. AK22]EXJ23177.1 HD family hydrolase [Alkalibacterium sp. AK22]
MEFVRSIWENDQDYMAHIGDLLESEELLKLDDITHHHYTTRLIHSLFVSYVSYKIAKRLKLNCRAVARAGLLHDFFHEGREEIAMMKQGSHNFVHPHIAVKNAQRLTELSELEKDIILKHMFMTTTGVGLPKYKESMVVTCVDKYCAISEVSTPVRLKVKEKLSEWSMKLRVVHA